MKLSQALTGFFMILRAEGYSNATLNLYNYALATLKKFLDDKDVENITFSDLVNYFVYFREEYPKEMNHEGKPLAGSSLQNHWKAIRCFFRWAKEERLIQERPDLRLKLPENNPRVIMPLEENEVKRLVDGAKYTRLANTTRRAAFTMKRPTAERDTALIILLLDTGIRAGEAGRLTIGDVDLNDGEITIAPYGSSNRKTKSRTIPLGKASRKAIWRYLVTRPEAESDEPLFLTKEGRKMDVNTIRLLVTDIGNKVGVKHCHPHRFRHTFAVEYLRNDGDIFTLQMILGHTTLEMVKHYLQLAKNDAKKVHKRASPADNWRL